MLPKLPEPVLLACLVLVGVLVACATFLAANGNVTPSWFESLALLVSGGVLGAYQPKAAA